MLNGRIMHECIQKLLRETDEESLECMCRLITTIGQVILITSSPPLPPPHHITSSPHHLTIAAIGRILHLLTTSI